MKSIVYTLLLFIPYFAFSQQTQIRIPVANGDDDVEVSTAIYATSSDLELGGFDSYNFGAQYTAIRFANIALPANAQISKAYIQFTVKDVSPTTANLTIKCQKGNAAAYLPTENLLQRTYVTPVVTWNPTAWTVLNEAGLNQQSASLTTQIQAAIATGWSSGNALSFVIQGNATQDNVLNARSYENQPNHAGAPELVIEYTTGTCSSDVTPPTFTGCPANISLTTSGTTAVATWTAPTVSDNCTTNITPSVSTSPTVGLVSGSTFPVGTTTVTYNAKDAANNNATPCTFTVTVTNNTTSSSVRIPLATGNDDIEVSATNYYSGSTDLDVGGFDTNIGGKQFVGIRFQNVTLPINAQITKAYIQFTALAPSTQTTSISIKCQQGNAAAYDPAQNILLRTYVPNIVTWNPPAWTVADANGINQQTANLAAQITSAMASGWQSGNALSFILQGNATSDNIINARSYETLATHAGAAELVIEYTTGTNPCSPDVTPPVFSNCPANITLTTTGTTAIGTWTIPTILDNCTTTITPSVTSSPTAGLIRGSAFPIGVTTVTYNAKDAANNNAAPCIFTVTVNGPCSPDVTPPVFSNCPANITLTTTGTTAIGTWTIPTIRIIVPPLLPPQ